jgi:uncharacterized protein (DUF2461 family)
MASHQVRGERNNAEYDTWVLRQVKHNPRKNMQATCFWVAIGLACSPYQLKLASVQPLSIIGWHPAMFKRTERIRITNDDETQY